LTVWQGLSFRSFALLESHPSALSPAQAAPRCCLSAATNQSASHCKPERHWGNYNPCAP